MKEEIEQPKERRKCDDRKRTKLERCMAGGFALAYTLGVTSTVLTGCSGTENAKNDKNDSKPITQEKDQAEKEEGQLLMATELTQTYSNKAIRTLESVKAQLGEEAYINEIANLGSAEDAETQAGYVSGIINDITETEGEEAATKVMRACGYKCLANSTIDSAKTIYEKSANMEEFLQNLNDASIGGGHLELKDNKITASYDYCYCDIDDSKDKLNRCYCQCSCGWFERLFANVLEKPVNVELTESIKEGAKACQFEISFEE